MTQVKKLDWKVVHGTLVEHAKSPDQRSYCIYELQDYELQGRKGELVYGSTRSWEMLRFQLLWQDLPEDMISDWQYFTTIEEARSSVGNLSNEEKGIEPFEYDTSRYTAEWAYPD